MGGVTVDRGADDPRLELLLREVVRVAADAPAADDTGLLLVVERHGLRCVVTTVDPPLPSCAQGLSPRELEVAQLIADGGTTRSIGSALQISEWTVCTHVRRIFAKVGARNRAEMVAKLFGHQAVT